MDVDAVQQGSGNPGPVALHLGRCTGIPGGDRKEPAGTGIHGRHQHEAGGIGQGGGGPGDGHPPVFQGLAQHFQDILPKFGQLVQEEHAVVGQADFAGPGDMAAADQSGVGDGVVRGAEGPGWSPGPVPGHQAHDAVDLGRLDGLLKAQLGEDRWEAAGPAWSCRTREADHQDIVAAGRGDLQGPLDVFLALHFGEIQGKGWLAGKEVLKIIGLRGKHGAR